jgi:hypothetical protein
MNYDYSSIFRCSTILIDIYIYIWSIIAVGRMSKSNKMHLIFFFLSLFFALFTSYLRDCCSTMELIYAYEWYVCAPLETQHALYMHLSIIIWRIVVVVVVVEMGIIYRSLMLYFFFVYSSSYRYNVRR